MARQFGVVSRRRYETVFRGSFRRKTNPQMSWFIRLSAFFGLLSAVCWMGYIYLTTNPYFALEEVRIKGNDRISKKRIQELLPIKAGDTLFTFNKKLLVERLKEEPFVKDIKIKRKIPQTLLLTIEERIPILLVAVKGVFWEIDAEKFLLSKIDPSRSPLLRVEGLKLQERKAGGRLIPEKGTSNKEDGPEERERKKETEACELLDKIFLIYEGELYNYIKVIDIRDKRDVRATLRNGILVKAGSLENLLDKSTPLIELLNQLRREEDIIEYIDIRLTSNYIVKKGGEDQAKSNL